MYILNLTKSLSNCLYLRTWEIKKSRLEVEEFPSEAIWFKWQLRSDAGPGRPTDAGHPCAYSDFSARSDVPFGRWVRGRRNRPPLKSPAKLLSDGRP